MDNEKKIDNNFLNNAFIPSYKLQSLRIGTTILQVPILTSDSFIDLEESEFIIEMLTGNQIVNMIQNKEEIEIEDKNEKAVPTTKDSA